VLYTPVNVASTSPHTVVAGKSLAHRQLRPWQRTKLSADLVDGSRNLERRTVGQACAVTSAKPTSVRAELKRRQYSRNRKRKLLSVDQKLALALERLWDSSTDDVRAALLQKHGADRCLELLTRSRANDHPDLFETSETD
jgi:hypothetical protein